MFTKEYSGFGNKKINSLYCISAYVKTESREEEIQFVERDFDGIAKSVSSTLTAYTKVSIHFQAVTTSLQKKQTHIY